MQLAALWRFAFDVLVDQCSVAQSEWSVPLKLSAVCDMHVHCSNLLKHGSGHCTQSRACPCAPGPIMLVNVLSPKVAILPMLSIRDLLLSADIQSGPRADVAVCVVTVRRNAASSGKRPNRILVLCLAMFQVECCRMIVQGTRPCRNISLSRCSRKLRCCLPSRVLQSRVLHAGQLGKLCCSTRVNPRS